jgi:hypothetical protein
MGLLNGGLSFRRYRVHQPLPEDFRDLFLENIQRLAFQENLKHRSKEPLMGWVNVANPDDTAFDLNKLLFDRYLVLGLRVDKKSVNGKLFQILLERQYRAVMAEKGVERLGKNHKEEIKEALEEELLGQTLPSVATYDLAWDIHTGEVLVFATSDALQETFQGLFHDTFGARLYPDRMVDWLREQWDWETIEQRVDGFIPGGALDRGLAVTEDGWHEGNALRGREFTLASEFLTWLWHESELKDGYFQLTGPKLEVKSEGSAVTEREAFTSDDEVDYDYRQAEEQVRRAQLGLAEPVTKKGGSSDQDEEFTLWMDNKLAFRDIEDVEEPGSTIMVGAAPSATPEAKLTMASGKRPVEARLGIRRGEHEWFFTLRAGPGGLELNGMKLPIEVKDGDEEKIYERMYLLNILSSAVRGLFRQFFEVRTSERWPGMIERWLEQDQAA